MADKVTAWTHSALTAVTIGLRAPRVSGENLHTGDIFLSYEAGFNIR